MDLLPVQQEQEKQKQSNNLRRVFPRMELAFCAWTSKVTSVELQSRAQRIRKLQAGISRLVPIGKQHSFLWS